MMQEIKDRAEARKKAKEEKKKSQSAKKKAQGGQSGTAPPAKKSKSAPKPKPKAYEPRVDDRVEARWMYGKKEQVPAGSGRSFVGNWYEARVTSVDTAAATASVIYLDKWVEEGVTFKCIKHLAPSSQLAPAPATP